MTHRLILIGKGLSTFFSKAVQTMISIVRIILLSRPVASLPKPLNKQCSILGNGPSLNASIENDIHFLKQTEIVCVNTFASSGYYELLKPSNYVLIDPLFFSEEGQHRDVVTSTFKALLDKTDWPLNLYVPRTNKKSFLLQNLLSRKKNISIVYFNYTIFEGFDSIKYFLFSKGISSPQSENVLVATLFLMISRSFEKIFIFGADHSWHEQIQIREDNILTLKDLHFYDSDKTKQVELPLFDASKKKKTIANQFLSFSKAFRGYDILAGYAEYKHVKIYNASVKSYVDAFERIKLNSTTD
jgi:hypothetical protein